VNRNDITSALEVAGAVSIITGVASFSTSAALIVGGALAILFGRAAA
jgi:hypothetical protein